MPRSFKARPTTDFAKENLFNVLANRIDLADNVSALDLFAGTGSISLELLSRGCQEVVSVEKDRDHFAFICKIRRELNAEGWKAACLCWNMVRRMYSTLIRTFPVIGPTAA